MFKSKGTLRTCKNGHQYYKSSDCPTCPFCEKERAPKKGFMTELSAPARRALENMGIKTVKKLSTYSEKEILALHGLGSGSIPKLRKALREQDLTFKKK
jgi:DNA-directed RNA polymerase alpha subunit